MHALAIRASRELYWATKWLDAYVVNAFIRTSTAFTSVDVPHHHMPRQAQCSIASYYISRATRLCCGCNKIGRWLSIKEVGLSLPLMQLQHEPRDDSSIERALFPRESSVHHWYSQFAPFTSAHVANPRNQDHSLVAATDSDFMHKLFAS